MIGQTAASNTPYANVKTAEVLRESTAGLQLNRIAAAVNDVHSLGQILDDILVKLHGPLPAEPPSMPSATAGEPVGLYPRLDWLNSELARGLELAMARGREIQQTLPG